MKRFKVLAALPLVCALTLAGCTQGEKPAATGSATQSKPAASQSEEKPDVEAKPAEDPDRDKRLTEPATLGLEDGAKLTAHNFPDYPKAQRYLKDVRVQTEGDAQRVVLEFTPPVEGEENLQAFPSYSLEYVPEVLTLGRGTPMELQGNAKLALHIVGLAAPMEPNAPNPYGKFKGEGIVQSGDAIGPFEAMGLVGLGLEKKVPVKVTELKEPLRLVLEFSAK